MAKKQSSRQADLLNEYLGLNKEKLSASKSVAEENLPEPEFKVLGDMPEGHIFKSGSNIYFRVLKKIMRQVPVECQWVIIQEVSTGADKHQFPSTPPSKVIFHVEYITYGWGNNQTTKATLR